MALSLTARRTRLREVLAGSACVSPASVYDALSARVAEAVGYQIGLFSGSVASSTVLAAPDLQVITSTEFAGQIRRITRACSLSLLVDADDGYGNALNVMRTVEEVEHAGASGMSIEDSAARGVGNADGTQMVSIEEMAGKLRAAMLARQDPSFVIVGRTRALRAGVTEYAVVRAKASAKAGADAVFLVGLENLAQVQAVHDAVPLPLIIGSTEADLSREDLAPWGARIFLQGHQPVAAAVKAFYETYTHLHTGGSPAELTPKIASPEEMERLTKAGAYREWQREYL